MFFVFDAFKVRLERARAGGSEEARALLREVGREALVEHAEWLLARRERPLSFVHR